MSEGRCARRPQLPPAAAVGALAPPPDTIDQLRGPANTREQLRAPQAGAGCGQLPAHPPPVQQRLRSTGGGRTAQTRYTTEPPRRRPRWQCGRSAAQRASAARQIQLRRLSADARQCASWSLSQARTCRNWFPEHACPRNWHPIKWPAQKCDSRTRRAACQNEPGPGTSIQSEESPGQQRRVQRRMDQSYGSCAWPPDCGGEELNSCTRFDIVLKLSPPPLPPPLPPAELCAIAPTHAPPPAPLHPH